MNELVKIIACGIVVERITEILVDSKIFEPVREIIFKRQGQIAKFTTEVLKCGYCCSVWVAGLIALLVDLEVAAGITGWLIHTFLLHGVSNFWHVLYMNTWRTKVQYHNITLIRENETK